MHKYLELTAVKRIDDEDITACGIDVIKYDDGRIYVCLSDGGGHDAAHFPIENLFKVLIALFSVQADYKRGDYNEPRS